MAPSYEEIENLIPKNSFIALVSILVATDVFILICTQVEAVPTPFWMFTASTMIFAALILSCFFVKLRITIEDDVIRIRFIKSYNIEFKDIIDHKIGDVSIIRNYSGWGLKNVKFKNLICVGYEMGISFKLMGRKVITISSSDPEKIASLIPITEDKTE